MVVKRKKAGKRKRVQFVPQERRRVSDRAISLKEFRPQKNNFELLFCFPRKPLADWHVENIRESIKATNSVLSKANLTVAGLRKAFPEELKTITSCFEERQRLFIGLNREFGLHRLPNQLSFDILRQWPKARQEAYLSRRDLIQKNFDCKTLRPLYTLYRFLKGKGLSNKDLMLTWWSIAPKSRK
ncbi:MAG: hypothetical protein WC634_00570 [archaeon]